MTATIGDPQLDARTLGHLDFTPSCSCESHGICGHAKGTECGDQAAVITTIHLVHQCTNPECDAAGNEIGPMCAACLDRVTAVVTDTVRRWASAARRIGGVAVCNTCGAPVMAVSDIIRDVRPIQ